MSISDVRYALESPWPCDELELGPSSRRRCLPGFFLRRSLRCRELEVAFSIVPFLSIDAVGSELWTALHEYINGDTHKSVFVNSSPVSFPTASSTACCSRPFLTCGFEASSLACCLALALVLQREHIPDFPCASLSQLATPQREPPPCFPHRSVVPRARLPQRATLQRQPPPCFPHRSVVPCAMLPQPATLHR